MDESLKAVFVTSLSDVIYRNRKYQGNFSLNIVKEPLTTYSIVMYLSQNFYLKNTLDEKLQDFDSSGLINFWVNKHADKRFLNTDSTVTGPKKLNLRHLYGTFCILMIGNGIGALIFIFEIFTFNLMKLKQKSGFVKSLLTR